MQASLQPSSPLRAPGRPPGRRGLSTAGRILDAAEARFAEHGFAGTSLRDVADDVGIRIPSLYNHFASKDALYAAVLERGIGPVLTLLSGLLEESAQTERREAAPAQVMDLLGEHPHLPKLVLQETLGGGQHLSHALRDWVGPIFAQAGELLQRDPRNRRWSSEQIPLLVLALYHIVVGYFATAPFYRSLTGNDLLDGAARARQTHFLEQAVAALLAIPETNEEQDHHVR